MSASFSLLSDPAERGQKRLVCQGKQSCLTAIHRTAGQELTLNENLVIVNGFYGPKDEMLIVHFELTPTRPDTTAELWPDELLLQAIRYYNEQMGLTDLMMVLQHQPVRSLFESEHCLVRQVIAPPAHLVDQLAQDRGYVEYLN